MAKLSVDQFAQQIKDKYPAYNSVDNATLVQKMLAKYPVYSDRVDTSSFNVPAPSQPSTGIISDLSQRASNIGKILSSQASKPLPTTAGQGALQGLKAGGAGLHIAGQIAGGVMDVVGGIANKVTQPFSGIGTGVQKAGEAIASQIPKPLAKGIQQTGQAALQPAVTGTQLGQKFAQKYPNATQYVKDIANIAQVIPTLAGAIEGVKALPDALKSAKDIADVAKSNIQERAIQTNADKLREAAGATKPTSKTMARALARGKDDASFLAKNNILPSVEEGKIRTSVAQSAIDRRVAPLNNLLNKGLDEIQPSIQLTNIDDVRAKALKGVDDTPNLTASERESFKKDINREFDLQKKKLGQDITLRQVNQEIKIPHSKKVPFDSTKPYRGNVNEIIRKAAQTTIEDSVPKDAFAVKELNSYIGDHYSAKKFLQSMEGNAVKGARLGKYFARVIGSGIGESIGGPLGGFAGLLGGEAVAEIMQNTAFTNPLREFILRNIAQDNPAAFEKLKQFISKSQAEQATRKLLPPGSAVLTPQYKGEIPNYGGVDTAGKPGSYGMQRRAIEAGVKIGQPSTEFLDQQSFNANVNKFTNESIDKGLIKGNPTEIPPQQESSKILGAIDREKEARNQAIMDYEKDKVNKESSKDYVNNYQGAYDKLVKYVDPRTGELPEILGKDTRVGRLARSKTGQIVNQFARKGDDIIGEINTIYGLNLQDHSDANDFIDNFKKIRSNARAAITKPTSISQNIPKQIDPLIQEAKKYKSAGEFVKAQGDEILHGTDKKFSNFDKSKIGMNEPDSPTKQAFFFTDSLDTAKSYGKNIIKRYGKFEKPLTIDAEGQTYGDFRESLRDVLEKAQNEGNDVVIIKNLSDRKDWGNYEPATHYAVIDTSKLKTKSQLTDIWNKANKVKGPGKVK